MTVRCIACRKFTLKPRASMLEMDRGNVAIGLGRCTVEKDGNVWHSQEYERACDHHDALTYEQTDQRRALVQQRRQIMLTTAK